MITNNTLNDLLDEASKLAGIVAEAEIGESVLGHVKASATELLHEIEAKANTVGLGSTVDNVVNKAEDMTSAEIDTQANAARMAMESAAVKTDQASNVGQASSADSVTTNI